jgi:hypothetical protein
MKQLPYIQTSTAIIGYSESLIAKNESNDCFVRAVASSFDCPYDTAHAWVKEKFNREDRKGTKWAVCKMATMSSHGQTFNEKSIKVVSNLLTIDAKKNRVKRTTLNQFIKKYPTGTYILIVRGHAFTLKDGSVIGNTSDAKSLKKIVHDAFEIK